MEFIKINISKWQQFESINLNFNKRLTVITGANGSGKSTILNILAKHNGWNFSSLATPRQEKKSGMIRFISGLFNPSTEDYSNKIFDIGSIVYSNNAVAIIRVPNNNQAQYQLEIVNQQPVESFFIPSHRPVFRYQAIDRLQTKKKTKKAAFDEIWGANVNRYFGTVREPSSFLMKNTLIGWAINGYGVQSLGKTIMAQDQEQADLYESFQAVLRKILPTNLGFEEFEIRNMEIVFICNGGKDEFLLETASGGISALIDIAWHIHMYSSDKNNQNFTVLIDEVENHLHPVMQRNILNDLLSAFPHVRFIVSSHSPLIVSSVEDCRIYVLKYNESQKIVSEELDLAGSPKTASEILDEVLGVSVTMPVWAEDRLNGIVNSFSNKNLEEKDLHEFRAELNKAGFEKVVPYAIGKLLEDKND